MSEENKRIEKLENEHKDNFHFSKHEVFKYREHEKELSELKEQLRLEKDMRITNTKTMNSFLNSWCNRVKNGEKVLREVIEEVYLLVSGMLNLKHEIGLKKNGQLKAIFNGVSERLDNLNRKLGGEKTVNEVNNPMSSGSGMKTETDSKPPSCEFYNIEYCDPCKSPNDITKCDLFQIGTQIKIEKWNPSEKDASSASHTETHGCFNCKYFINYDLCEERNFESYEMFKYFTFLTAICNNWKANIPGGIMNGDREIPPYWRAAIKKGILTEKMYWKNVVPSQIAVGRAKERQRKRLIKEFLADLNKVEHWPVEGLYMTPKAELTKIREKWEGRLND